MPCVTERPRARGRLAALFVAALTGACGSPVAPTTGRVEQRTFDSVAADEPFTLLVRLPPGYDADTSRRYPVLYQLDATFLDEFAHSAGTVSRLEAAGAIPATVVVGIGHASPRADRTRFVDFVPPDPAVPGSPGRAPAFYRFVHDELVPFVERTWRVVPGNSRALSGHSLGGLFTLYALLQREPDGSAFFTRAVAADPSYGTNDGVLLAVESAAAAARADRPGRLHLSASRYTGAVQLLLHNEYARRLSSDFPLLQLRTAYVDTDHGGLLQRAMDEGFPFALAAEAP